MFKPQFSVSNDILKHIGVIEGAREVIDYAVMVPAWEAKFKEEARVRINEELRKQNVESMTNFQCSMAD